MDSQKSIARAAEAMTRGSLTEAEAECRSVLALYPRHHHALKLLGEVLTRGGKKAEAQIAFDRAELSRPGATPRFTQLALERFRTEFGPPVPARPEGAHHKGRVQMRSLGQNGRYGNQLLQYGFVRLYAHQNDLVAEFPDWIGRDIFDLDDPFPSTNLPTLHETDADLVGSLQGQSGQVFADRNFEGYFGGNTEYLRAWKDELGSYFVPGKKVRELLAQALDSLRSMGETIVAIHLRHGDFGYGRFWVAPPSWYLTWLRNIWSTLKRPVLYIASDTAGPHMDFSDFNPRLVGHLGIDMPGLGFLIDHHILRHADHLAIANSSFSFTAAMLNAHAQSFLRPEPSLRELVAFDPWASDVLLDAIVEPQAIEAAERMWLQTQILDTDTVIYWGNHCSAWTNFMRSVHGRLRVFEAESHTCVADLLCLKNIRNVRLLVLENADIQRKFTMAAPDILHQAQIDMVLLRPDPAPRQDSIFQECSALGYTVFCFHKNGLIPISQHESYAGKSCLAVRRELATAS